MPLLLDKQIDFHTRPLLFIDLEMTGLDADVHEIIEIAALVVRQSDFEITNSYYTKVIAEHPETAHPDAVKLLGYSPQTWTDAIPLKQALTELSQLAPDCYLAGWSVQNEWDFLIAGLKKHHLPYFFDYHLIEVWSLAYSQLRNNPGISRLNIQQVCDVLGVPVERHKPDSDIKATYDIFKKLVSSSP